jgi:hypothetical protein
MSASARKHAYPVNTRTKRWTNTDVIKFKQLLEKIKRPEEPFEEREEFLKLHPVSRPFFKLLKHFNSSNSRCVKLARTKIVQFSMNSVSAALSVSERNTKVARARFCSG